MTSDAFRFGRRDFLATLATASLSACATVPRGEPCTPLPAVAVDPSRVIRTPAGLRPYRSAGFVVRAEPLGDQRLVHNYGHGGAGLTLSWGTAKLAVDLGLPGHSGPVAVIGAGVVGLSTARLVQEAGFPVTIYAAELPPATTSNLAAGQWGPTGHYREERVSPQWRQQYAAALAASWKHFSSLDGPSHGVRWLPTYAEAGRVAPPGLAPYYPDAELLGRGEHPFPLRDLVRYRTMYVEPDRYLARLAQDLIAAGGHIRVRRFAAPAELAALDETLLFNCTGLGSRDLFGDGELRPARGQLVVLEPQPEVQYAFSGAPGYMFPRPDGVVLGGTFELDQWSTTPDPATVTRLIESHRRLVAGLRCRLDPAALRSI